jgi:hypothetical protein
MWTNGGNTQHYQHWVNNHTQSNTPNRPDCGYINTGTVIQGGLSPPNCMDCGYINTGTVIQGGLSPPNCLDCGYINTVPSYTGWVITP